MQCRGLQTYFCSCFMLTAADFAELVCCLFGAFQFQFRHIPHQALVKQSNFYASYSITNYTNLNEVQDLFFFFLIWQRKAMNDGSLSNSK